MPVARSVMRGEVGAMLALAAPLAGANLAQMAMGLTNAMMVGRLGGASLAAAGLGAALYFTLAMVCQGVLIAVAPLAAHAIGRGEPEAAGRIGGAGMILAAMLALPVLALLTVAPHALALIGYEARSEEHTSELQSRSDLVCRLLLEKKKKNTCKIPTHHKKKKRNQTSTT